MSARRRLDSELVRRSIAPSRAEAVRLIEARRVTVGGVLADKAARLVAAGAGLVRGEASPQLVQLAVDTASQQGWRRPLLAWLGVQIGLAERAGQEQEAQRLRRRAAIARQEP
mgnify:CR=1 FL=1